MSRLLRKHWLCAIFFLFWTFWSVGGGANPSQTEGAKTIRDSLARFYDIDLDLTDSADGILRVRTTIRLKNLGQKALDHVVLVLYPNRFQTELPHLNDVSFRRVYPDHTSLGSMEILSAQTAAGQELVFEDVLHLDLPPRTFVRAKLPKPIEGKQTGEFTLKVQVQVPKKYGSFGLYRKSLTLSGGWSPYVASYGEVDGFRLADGPPRATWNISTRSPTSFALGTQYYSDPSSVITSTHEGHRQVSLFVRPQPHLEILRGRKHVVRLMTEDSYKPVLDQLRPLLASWLAFVEAEHELLLFSQTFNLVQAPLRRQLMSSGEGSCFFSDRAFKLLPMLAQYHAVPIVHGLFYQLLLPTVSKRENARDYHWVSEVLAWHWTKRFVEHLRYQHLDARSRLPMRVLSFLVVFDRIIYSPQFAFFDAFFNAIHLQDPIRDDALMFNHRRRVGRSVLANLEDEVGEDGAGRIAQAYLPQTTLDFVSVAEKVTQRPLKEEFVRWMARRPWVNYAIQKHEEKKKDGGYAQTVTVKREAKELFAEPVELGVRTRDGKSKRLLWKDAEPEHVFAFETKTPVSVLEVDPRGRLLEAWRGDNRKPTRYKIVLTEYVINYDFNEDRPYGFVSGSFRKALGGPNRYTFRGAYLGDSYGGGVGYTRLFGRLVDRLRLNHGLGASLGFDHLNSDAAWAVRASDGAQEAVEISSAALATTVNVSYFFGSQLSFTNPLEGGYAGLGVTWGTALLGGEVNYYRASLSGSWVFPLRPSHLLAVLGRIGLSGPEDIPSPVQFHLGGINGIRGLSVTDDRFTGRNVVLMSGEYRHYLLRDLDWDFGLFRLRDVQGAFFVDAGNASDTVLERANRLAFSSGVTGNFWDLFDIRDFATDAGYGIRLLLDYLGVQPGLIRFDAAKSLTGESGGPIRFYFGVTQSF